jgi:hypothetical protein
MTAGWTKIGTEFAAGDRVLVSGGAAACGAGGTVNGDGPGGGATCCTSGRGGKGTPPVAAPSAAAISSNAARSPSAAESSDRSPASVAMAALDSLWLYNVAACWAALRDTALVLSLFNRLDDVSGSRGPDASSAVTGALGHRIRYSPLVHCLTREYVHGLHTFADQANVQEKVQ